MGDQLKGGARDDLGDSLALYLEQAFDDVRAEFGLEPLPAEGRDDRLMLFLGIGRGVVDYLRDFEAAFVIERHDLADVAGNDSAHDSNEDGHVRIRVVP